MINISKWNIEEGSICKDTGDRIMEFDVPAEDLKYIWDTYEMTLQEYVIAVLGNGLTGLNKN